MNHAFHILDLPLISCGFLCCCCCFFFPRRQTVMVSETNCKRISAVTYSAQKAAPSPSYPALLVRYNRAKLHCSDFKFCTEKTGCTSTSHKLVTLKSTDVCPLLGCYKAWLISPQLCHLPALSLHHSAISEWVSKKGSSTSTIFAADCFDTAPQEPRYPESAWKPIYSSV